MTAGARVTPTEYHRLSWIAGERQTDISNLLRSFIEPLLAEYAGGNEKRGG